MLLLTGPVVLLAAYLRRPFWYDEIWRGHFVSEPLSSVWSELAVANTPSALGWFGLVRLSGEAFGWHTWALRLPGLLALPALGVAVAVLVRRFAGSVAAAFAVCWLCLNATFLDLATQLKPYTVETVATVAVVLLWLGPVRGGDTRGRGARRMAAGVVALCSVPAVFVIVPLAAMDVLGGGVGGGGGGGGRSLLRRGQLRRSQLGRCLRETLPAVVLVTVHTLVFLGHQSAQRAGDYWDTQFLAGRDPWQAMCFVGDQLWRMLAGSPPGIDQFDPSLVPGYLHLPHYLPWLLAPLTGVFGAVGIAALARRADGRRVLAALVGAEVLMLGASAVRFWPFGPTRTNQFVVPLLLLVVVVGVDRVVRQVVRRVTRDRADAAPRDRLLSVLGATSGAMVLLIVAGVALAGGLSGDRLLWERRDRLRGLDLMVDATVATRRLVRPGDVVVVGGRLARPGWIYAMEVSDDLPRQPGALPPVPAGTAAGAEAPRVARADTVFVVPGLLRRAELAASTSADSAAAADSGTAVDKAAATLADTAVTGSTADSDSVGSDNAADAAAVAHLQRSKRLIVFVFDIEEKAIAADLAALRQDGWCPGEQWSFRLTGSVTVYERCGRPNGAEREMIHGKHFP
ncbi:MULTISPECIES: hypothetical protein [Parafrankia]|uniref:hypothetical protein n=1 Tax=Parafrankia TaxID=2994362 RepID=UPI0018666B75|nr:MULTISPECIES: hypothetical protein [Parafrankia]MBE3204342.1 hypothetical protein [Parafrankia sp. CH37]